MGEVHRQKRRGGIGQANANRIDLNIDVIFPLNRVKLGRCGKTAE